MERKNVQITIESTQHDVSDATEKNTYQGTYGFRDGKHYISYRESVMPDQADAVTKNIIKITDSVLSISKTGALKANMQFEQEKSHQGLYQTPLGDFAMSLHTKRLDIHAESGRLFVHVNYDLYLNQGFVSNCTVKMFIVFNIS